MSLKNYTASTVLNYTPQKARLVLNLLSAASNLSLVESEYSKFKVDSIFAEEAQRLYRSIPRARGTAHRIARRYSRIKVTLAAI